MCSDQSSLSLFSKPQSIFGDRTETCLDSHAGERQRGPGIASQWKLDTSAGAKSEQPISLQVFGTTRAFTMLDVCFAPVSSGGYRADSIVSHPMSRGLAALGGNRWKSTEFRCNMTQHHMPVRRGLAGHKYLISLKEILVAREGLEPPTPGL